MSVGLEEVQQLAGVGHPEAEGWGVGSSWLLIEHPVIVIVKVKFQNLRLIHVGQNYLSTRSATLFNMSVSRTALSSGTSSGR